MNAKTLGLIIIVIGLLLTLYTGFNCVTREFGGNTMKTIAWDLL